MKRTRRNVFCPKYRDCLFAAVDLELEGWSCEGCRHEKENAGIGETDFLEYYKLLGAIFKPKQYARYRVETGEDPPIELPG